MTVGVLYVLGVLAIFAVWGGYWSIDRDDAEDIGPVLLMGVWIWPILLPLILAAFVGHWIVTAFKGKKT